MNDKHFVTPDEFVVLQYERALRMAVCDIKLVAQKYDMPFAINHNEQYFLTESKRFLSPYYRVSANASNALLSVQLIKAKQRLAELRLEYQAVLSEYTHFVDDIRKLNLAERELTVKCAENSLHDIDRADSKHWQQDQLNLIN